MGAAARRSPGDGARTGPYPLPLLPPLPLPHLCRRESPTAPPPAPVPARALGGTIRGTRLRSVSRVGTHNTPPRSGCLRGRRADHVRHETREGVAR